MLLAFDWFSKDDESLVYIHHVLFIFKGGETMNKKYIFSIVIVIAFHITAAWGGPGSTTNDLMSQSGGAQPASAAAAQPAPATVENCPAAQAIDTANNDAAENNLPFSKPWVAFSKPDLLREPFSFQKTLDRIIETSGQPTTTAPAELISTMVESQSLSSAINPDSSLITPLDARTLESQINPQAAVDEWFPVGVFNRLDTAPIDGSHCGEYRIVYANPGNAIDPTLQAGFSRFLTIFEAAIPNPQPEKGIQGCAPIGDFWASLANPDLGDEERVVLLEDFFYNGISSNSNGENVFIEPAVKFSHYQSPLGQVRTNEFLDFRWQLREFETGLDGNNKPIFSVGTVKNNALTEFYNLESNFPSDDADNLSLFDSLSAEFQGVFITQLMDELTSADSVVQEEKALINRISMVVPNKFNEFQSDSQVSNDNIAQQAGSALMSRIGIKLNEINTPETSITQEHILERAEAMRCGGCHQTSNNKIIATLNSGAEVRWPNSLGFVHIDESGQLSPALKDTFLPAREEVLKNFVCSNQQITCKEQTEDLSEASSIVQSSGDLNPDFASWKAFDSSPSSIWVSSVRVTPAWISYSWDTTQTINKYSITYAGSKQNGSVAEGSSSSLAEAVSSDVPELSSSSLANQDSSSLGESSRRSFNPIDDGLLAPKNWELQGWNGTEWEVIDSRSNEASWSGGETRTFTVATPNSFAKYRLNVTDDNIGLPGVLLIAIGDVSFESCN